MVASSSIQKPNYDRGESNSTRETRNEIYERSRHKLMKSKALTITLAQI